MRMSFSLFKGWHKTQFGQYYNFKFYAFPLFFCQNKATKSNRKQKAFILLRLYILRHAKSSWALPGKSDIERGLNDRGTKDLRKIAKYLHYKNYKPDQVYSSPSTRTRLTIEGIISCNNEINPPVNYTESLYSGSLNNYLECLQTHHDNTQSLMIVGHNPTCDSLAAYLIGDGKGEHMDVISHKFPTGALAVIDISKNKWSDISKGAGYLIDFALPRQL